MRTWCRSCSRAGSWAQTGSAGSGAEELAYNLKTLGRATLVGETTGGGAHPVNFYQINPHFEISIPFARAVNPVTGSNWEGTGVTPDIHVPAADALRTAHTLALRAVLDRLDIELALPECGLPGFEAGTKLPPKGPRPPGGRGRLLARVWRIIIMPWQAPSALAEQQAERQQWQIGADRRRCMKYVIRERDSASLHRGAKRLVLSLPATLKLRAERAFVTFEHREHNARVAEERSEASTAARSAGAKARLVSCERSEPESCRA